MFWEQLEFFFIDWYIEFSMCSGFINISLIIEYILNRGIVKKPEY